MEKRKIKYASSDSKTWIHAVMWIPEGKVRGVILFSHGVTENAERHEELAEYFTERGFVVAANDHLGHGNSYNGKENKMFFDCWQYLVLDFKSMYDIVKDQYKDVPIFVIGFSMGSFVARDFANLYSHKLAGAVYIGTGYQPKMVTKAMRKIIDMYGKKHGMNKSSDFIKKLAFGTYNDKIKNHKTDFDWICADEAALADYIADSNVSKFVTPGLFREMLQGIENTCDPTNMLGMTRRMPILLMSGSEDPVGDNTKGVKKLAKIFRDEAMRDVTELFYPGARHDILNEGSVKVKVYYDLENWIEERML